MQSRFSNQLISAVGSMKLKQHWQQHVGKKAGDKIVKMLSKSSDSKKVLNVGNVPKKKKTKKVTFAVKKLSDQEIKQRVNQIVSGGRNKII